MHLTSLARVNSCTTMQELANTYLKIFLMCQLILGSWHSGIFLSLNAMNVYVNDILGIRCLSKKQIPLSISLSDQMKLKPYKINTRPETNKVVPDSLWLSNNCSQFVCIV